MKLAIALDRAVSLKDITAHPILADLAALIDSRPQRRATELTDPAASEPHRKEIDDVVLIPASLLDVDLQPGKPPMLRADATGDAPRWAAEHRDALRAVVAEHGSLLVRGLGLRDAAEVGAVVPTSWPAA